MALMSQRLIDFNIECEVSSKEYYERCLQHPEWPGGRSGVTEGIGYDLGYADEKKLERDWVPVVNDVGALSLMRKCLGVHGEAAHALLSDVRSGITVTWNQACAVFLERDIPEYTNGMIKAIPGAEKLPPDCIGVLFSLGYNRGNGGWTSSNPRFAEMRAIRQAIIDKHPERVPDLIRKMKRLWPSNDKRQPDRGLRARRDKEAALFEQGLKKSNPPALVPVGTVNPKRQLPPAPGSTAQHGTAGGVAAGAAEAANQASQAGASWPEVAFIVIGGAIAAFIVWKIIQNVRTKKAPTLARVKDREV